LKKYRKVEKLSQNVTNCQVKRKNNFVLLEIKAGKGLNSRVFLTPPTPNHANLIGRIQTQAADGET